MIFVQEKEMQTQSHATHDFRL